MIVNSASLIRSDDILKFPTTDVVDATTSVNVIGLPLSVFCRIPFTSGHRAKDGVLCLWSRTAHPRFLP